MTLSKVANRPVPAATSTMVSPPSAPVSAVAEPVSSVLGSVTSVEVSSVRGSVSSVVVSSVRLGVVRARLSIGNADGCLDARRRRVAGRPSVAGSHDRREGNGEWEAPSIHGLFLGVTSANRIIIL